MPQQDMMQTVMFDKETTTLAEMAGLDINTFAEKRASQFPIGTYKWRIVRREDDVPLGLVRIGEDDPKPAVPITLKCEDVIAIKDMKDAPDGNPMNLIGKTHQETFFVSGGESIGYLTAFIHDIGFKGSITFLELDKLVGIEFIAPIVHRANAKDKDAPPYVNINRNKIVPALKAAA